MGTRRYRLPVSSVLIGIMALAVACTQTTNTTTNNITQQQVVVVNGVAGQRQDALPPGGIGACSLESRLKSMASTQPVTITFRNETAGDIILHWLDFDGHRKLYGRVDKGATKAQSTFVTHPWVVTDGAGQCLEIVMPGRTTQMVVVRNQALPPAPTAKQ